MKFFFFILYLLLLFSCSKESNDSGYTTIPEEKGFNPTLLNFEIPANFPDLTYDIKSNPPTEEGFALGKRLFYEGKLSSTGIISCGECHRQDFAFTHHMHITSHGVNNAIGTRNSPPLHNLAFMKEFNWDGAAQHLDAQPIIPITSEIEMNETFSSILAKLENDEKYPPLFAAAFENRKIDTENLLKALSQFMVMMTSANSTYDRVIREEGNVQFNDVQLAGKKVFEAKCATCHATDLFTDQTYRNNGLPIDPEYNDMGRELITGEPADRRKFKVPSLRNITLTLPYMHDGRFGTLEKVLDFYSDGMIDSETLDPSLKKEGKLGIPLSAEEKTQLLAFLNTLTDTNFAFDRRFAEF